MNITVFDYADAVGVHLGTARRRLECVPRDVQSRPHRYGLADALLTLKKKEVDDGAMRRLVATVVVQGDRLYVADDVTTAKALFALLPQDCRARFDVARSLFFASVANSAMAVSSVMETVGSLADLLLLQPDVLRCVVGVDATCDVAGIAPAFALVNCNNWVVTSKS